VLSIEGTIDGEELVRSVGNTVEAQKGKVLEFTTGATVGARGVVAVKKYVS